MPEGGSFIPEHVRTMPLEAKESTAEKDFFSGLVIDRVRFEAEHPFGPDVAPAELIENRREQAKSIFQEIRQSKWGKPLMGLMGVLAGMGPLLFDRMKDQAAAKEETVEVAVDDPGVQYEMQRLVLEDLMKKGEMTVEYEGRFGRQSWDQLTRLAYQDFPTLGSKFEYLHKDSPEIVATYKDPRGKIDNYRQLYEMMSIEFKHSSLPFQFSEKCVEQATVLIPDLPPAEGLKVYQQFSQELYRSIGFRAVRELALGLAESLPPEHPVMQEIEKQAWLSDEAADWLKPQKDNSAYFDQVTGRVRIYHRVRGEQLILLDTFPGNGGPTDGVAWERGLPAQVAVRTPDGEFSFARSFEKKSSSWQYSWVADTAALRWTTDHKEVEYQDDDGTWRRLTGEDAEFTVMGSPEKPFKLKKKSVLYNSATDRTGEEASYPAPFDASDVLDEKSELRATWDLNDFGPRSIQMKDENGQTMSIFFHSSPHDERPQEFLDHSHGCIHMKPIDIDRMSGYLDKGSSIRISSGEISASSQKENRGSASVEIQLGSAREG